MKRYSKTKASEKKQEQSQEQAPSEEQENQQQSNELAQQVFQQTQAADLSETPTVLKVAETLLALDVESSDKGMGGDDPDPETHAFGGLLQLGAGDGQPEDAGDDEGLNALNSTLAVLNGGSADAPLMRDEKSDGAIDTAGMTENIQQSTSFMMPKQLVEKYSSVLDHDVSHVQVHIDGKAALAAESAKANAFAVGTHIFFNQGKWMPGTPNGDMLIIHELTHVMQYDWGQLPSGGGKGLSVSEGGDTPEMEADNMAYYGVLALRSADQGEDDVEKIHVSDNIHPITRGSRPEDQPMKQFMRSAIPQNAELHREEGAGGAQETQVHLQLPFGSFRLQTPEAEAGATVQAENISPIAGLTLTNIQVTLDEDLKAESGSLTAQVAHGPASGNTDLQIGSQGNVSGDLAVQLNLANIGTGSGTVVMAEEGLSGTGTIASSDIQFGHAMVGGEGQLDVAISTERVVTGSGTLSGQVPTVGTFTMEGVLAEEALSGEGSVALSERVLIGDVKMNESTIEGSYSKETFVVGGQVPVSISDWAAITAEGSFDVGEKKFTGGGEATVSEKQLGGAVTVSEGTVNTSVEANEWQGGSAALKAEAGNFKGEASGTYAPVEQQVDLTVTAAYEGEADFDPMIVESLTGTMLVDDNIATEVTSVSGSAKIKQGETEAFQAGLTEGSVDLENKLVDATASVNTLPEGGVPFADGHLKLRLAETVAEVQDNALSSISGDFGLTAVHNNKDLVNIAANGSVLMPEITVPQATGQASLGEEGIELGGLTVDSVNAQATVVNDEVTTAESTVGFHTENISGNAAGTFDVSAGLVSGEGSAELTSALSFASVVTLDEATGTGTVVENTPTLITGTAAGQIAVPGIPLDFVASDLSVNLEESKASGEIEVSSQEDTGLEVENVGRITMATAAGTLADNQVERLSGGIGGTLAPGGTDLLNLSASGAFRVEEKVVEEATGTVELAADEVAIGDSLKVTAFSATASVRENVPSISAVNAAIENDSFTAEVSEGSYDFENNEVSGSASAVLNQPLVFGSLTISEAMGTVVLENNTFKNITDASFESNLVVGDNTFTIKSESVDIDLENRKVSGEITASTDNQFIVVPGIIEASLADMTGTITDNELTEVSGGGSVFIMNNGSEVLTVTLDANSSYNVQSNTILHAAGSASLNNEMSLFGDALIISEFSASAVIDDNELTSADATINVTIPAVRDMEATLSAGITRASEGGLDFAGSVAIDPFPLIEENAQGRSFSLGGSGSFDTAADTWTSTLNGAYQVNEDVGGTLNATMDQEFNPGFSGTFTGNATLVEATTLFEMEQTLARAQFGPVGLGLDAAIKLESNALEGSFSFEIEDYWYPITQGTDLPNFSADLGLDWGVTGVGSLIPKAYVGVDLPGLVTLAAGLKGAADLIIDAPVGVDVHLESQNDEYSGTAGIALGLNGSLDLSAGVFAQIGVLGWDAVDWEKGDILTYTLPDLFNLEWGHEFAFGDAGSSVSAELGSSPTEISPTANASKDEAPSSATALTETNTTTSNSSAPAGGPEVQGSEMLSALSKDGDSSDSSGGQMDRMETCLNGMDALGRLYNQVKDFILNLTNPAGWFEIIVDIWRGNLDFDEIYADAQAVMSAIDVIIEFVAELIEGGWIQRLWGYVQDGVPGILDVLFGADDRAREVVRDGETIRLAPPDMLRELLDAMSSGWVTDGDDECIVMLCEEANRRGILSQVMTRRQMHELTDKNFFGDSAVDGQYRRRLIALFD